MARRRTVFRRILMAMVTLIIILGVLGQASAIVYSYDWIQYQSDPYYYKFDKDTRTLTFKGSGAITNFDSGTNPPWCINDDYIRRIKKVVIESGITEIGDNAFSLCRNLEEVQIPASITRIGKNAFAGTKIESVFIPNGVIEIDDYAFSMCIDLESVLLPNSIETIGMSAFWQTDIESVRIPSGLQSMDVSSFDRDVTFIINENSYGEQFAIENGFTFVCSNQDYAPKSNSANMCGDNLVWEFDEGNGTLTIRGTGEMYDYDGSSPWYSLRGHIKTVVVEEGVTTIGNDAFRACRQIEKIELPDTLTRIGESAFSLTKIEEINIPYGVTTIERATFSLCLNLKRVAIPESVVTIEWAFWATGIEEIEIPSSVLSIDEDSFDTAVAFIVERGSYAEEFAINNGYQYSYIDDKNVDSDIANSELEYDFKQFRWGDSREDIIAIEGTPIYEKDGQMGYLTTAADLDAMLFYYVSSDGLYGLNYVFMEDHTVETLYIDDYNRIKDAISDKYGQPDIDDEEWDTSRHREYYSDDLGTALKYGYLTYRTRYYLDRTWIEINMSADNFNIVTTVSYLSNVEDVVAPETDYSDDF